MANRDKYIPVFSEDVVARLVLLSRGKQRQVILLAQQLASHPFVRSDYTLSAENGRHLDFLLTGISFSATGSTMPLMPFVSSTSKMLRKISWSRCKFIFNPA